VQTFIKKFVVVLYADRSFLLLKFLSVKNFYILRNQRNDTLTTQG